MRGAGATVVAHVRRGPATARCRRLLLHAAAFAMHHRPETMKLSVIIPTLNEEKALAATIRQARQAGVHEIIVSDGGSSDRTVAVATGLADRVIQSPPGRAVQMNAAAAVAAGDVLLFLHADTLPPPDFAAVVGRALRDPGVCGGRFDVRLEPSSPLLWLTATLINLRSRLSWISTGDQAIFVRRETFADVGRFPNLALLEDIAFSRLMKRQGRVACLREQVATSSRRWRADGVVHTILLMWTLRVLFFLGVSPARLRRLYIDRR